MKIQEFNGLTLDAIREALNEVLSDFGKEVGVKFNLGRISYDDKEFKTQLRCVISDSANVSDQDAIYKVDWDRNCHMYGLKPNDRLKVIRYKGTSYTIRTIKPKSRKYPIVCSKSDGKGVKFTLDIIKSLLKEQS